MNNAEKAILHLSLISGVGPATIHTLVQHAAGNLDCLYTYKESDFKLIGCSAPLSANIVKGLKDQSLLAQELELIDKYTITLCFLGSSAYPALLQEIYLPPAVLYVKGSLESNEPRLAVVGSRKATVYGQKVVDMLIPDLVDSGLTIVSGGAVGIDTYAHMATVQQSGKTIAVLGSGLLKPYPYANKKCFEQIVAQGGALVSSFSLKTDPHPGHFPARNRIIAGMSEGCLVVQAGRKSGALITAQFALEQGREVFAIPGSISEPLSMGCHELIVQGALLVNNAQDVLNTFEHSGIVAHKPKPKVANIASEQVSLTTLTVLQEKVVQGCQKPSSVDDIAHELNINLHDAQALLFDLQLDGLVVQHMSGLWQAQKVLD